MTRWASRIVETEVGDLWLIANNKTLWAAEFEPRWALLTRRVLEQKQILIGPKDEGRSSVLTRATRALEKYFEGELDALHSIELDLEGPPLHQRVWKAVRRIPPGRTISYKDLAKRAKKVGAFRAIGAANGANRCALFVPCHRIVSTSGALQGYGGGIAIKSFLLTHEGIENDGKRILA